MASTHPANIKIDPMSANQTSSAGELSSGILTSHRRLQHGVEQADGGDHHDGGRDAGQDIECSPVGILPHDVALVSDEDEQDQKWWREKAVHRGGNDQGADGTDTEEVDPETDKGRGRQHAVEALGVTGSLVDA